MQNIVFNLKLNSKDFTTSVKGAGDALDNAKKKVEEVGDEAKKAGGKIKDTEKDVQGLGASLGKLGAAAVAAFSVGAVIQFGKEVARASAEMEGLNIRMKSLHGDSEVANRAMAGLKDMANEYGLELKGLTSSYLQFVSAAKASGTEVAKAEKIFKSMSIAIAGSGVSSEQASRAFTAMTQMMSKNQVMAEELRGQLAEALPQSIGIMAKSLGVSTQELGKMMEKGELIASEVLPKFAKEMEKALGPTAQELATGMQAEITRLENAWFELYATIGDSVIVEKGVKVISGSLSVLTATYRGLAKVIALTMAAAGDNSLMFEIIQEDVAKSTAESQNRIMKSAQESASAIVAGYEKQGKKKEDIVKLIQAEISANEKLLVTGENITSEQAKRNFMLQANIDAMREELSVYEPSSNAREKSSKEIKKESDALKKLSEDRKKAQKDLFEYLNSEEAKKNLQYTVQEPKGVRDIDKNKATEAAKELKETNEAELTQFQGLMSNLDNLKALDQISEEKYLNDKLALHKEYGQETTKVDEEIFAYKKQQVQDEKELEEQKKAMKIDMALQSFELLSALNARYSQGQTEQLNKQLQQGIISQEAYDEQMRKIKRRQAVIDKAGALFQIGLSTAMNATSSALKPAMLPYVIAMGALQAATVIAAPIPYNKGTKRVPFARGAVRGKDSVHAILTPNERVVPESVNMQPGYSALMDLAQDRKISDSEAGFIADLATSGYRANNQAQTASIDYDLLGRSIAKYFPGTDVKIDKNGIAVISERHMKEHRRLTSKL